MKQINKFSFVIQFYTQNVMPQHFNAYFVTLNLIVTFLMAQLKFSSSTLLKREFQNRIHFLVDRTTQFPVFVESNKLIDDHPLVILPGRPL